MPRNEEMPVESDGHHEGKRYNHPAFGQLRASRVSGRTTLYGSDFVHEHFMIVEIHRSELNRDNSRDWYFPRQVGPGNDEDSG